MLGETEEINGNSLKYFGLCSEMRNCDLPIKTQECQPLERDVRCMCTDIPDQESGTLNEAARILAREAYEEVQVQRHLLTSAL